MTQHPDLHRDDVKLLTNTLTDLRHGAAAGAGALVLGHCIHDLHTRQIRRQRLALATGFCRLAGCGAGVLFGQLRLVVGITAVPGQFIGFVEEPVLGRRSFGTAAELAPARHFHFLDIDAQALEDFGFDAGLELGLDTRFEPGIDTGLDLSLDDFLPDFF